LINEMTRNQARPVVLVGHSLGGLTVSAVAEAIPERVSAVVYLTAFLLPSGMTAHAMIEHPTMADSVVPSLFLADPGLVQAMRIDPRNNIRHLQTSEVLGCMSNAGVAVNAKNPYHSLNVGSVHPPQTQGKVQSAVRLALSGRYLLQASARTGLIDCQMTSKVPEEFILPIMTGLERW
jgi:pimeloyl-ACP methyl ester carboxylesterase